jgi:hypothetical protein
VRPGNYDIVINMYNYWYAKVPYLDFIGIHLKQQPRRTLEPELILTRGE